MAASTSGTAIKEDKDCKELFREIVDLLYKEAPTPISPEVKVDDTKTLDKKVNTINSLLKRIRKTLNKDGNKEEDNNLEDKNISEVLKRTHVRKNEEIDPLNEYCKYVEDFVIEFINQFIEIKDEYLKIAKGNQAAKFPKENLLKVLDKLLVLRISPVGIPVESMGNVLNNIIQKKKAKGIISDKWNLLSNEHLPKILTEAGILIYLSQMVEYIDSIKKSGNTIEIYLNVKDKAKEYLKNDKKCVNELISLLKKFKVDNSNYDMLKLKLYEKYQNKDKKEEQSSDKIKIRFKVTDPIINFTGRKETMEQIHEKLINRNTDINGIVISSLISIVGLGGIGKTEITKMYIHEYGRKYKFIAWIDAETDLSIIESFMKLAAVLIEDNIIKMSADILDKQDFDITLRSIYRIFKESGLIIFDNTQKYDSISKYLPEAIESEYKNISVLITSRNKEWQNAKFEVISLDTFTENEAYEFVKTELELTENNEEIMELVFKMHHLPLALSKATSYIKRKRKLLKPSEENYNIKEFLIDFDKNPKKCLHHNKENNNYLHTVYTIVSMTLEQIKEQHEDAGEIAISIFKILIYLAPENLDFKACFMEQFSKIEDEDLLLESRQLLENFSLINVTGQSTSVHRLVQEVVRMQLTENKEDYDILKDCIEVIRNEENKSIRDSHKLFVFSHACQSNDLINFYQNADPPFDLRSETIFMLIKFGSIENQSDLLNVLFKNVNVNYTDKEGNSLLLMVAKNGRLDLFKDLINRGADINHTNLYKESALMFLVQYNPNKKLLKQVDFGNYDENYEQSISVLVYEAKDQTEIFKVLLDKGANIGYVDVDGKSLLMYAAKGGNVDIFEMIMEIGADITHTDRQGKTVLMYAAEEGDLDIVKMLITKGAEINHLDEQGKSVLQYAEKGGNLHIFKLLIKNRARIHYINEEGKHVIIYAAEEGDLDTFQILMKKRVHIQNFNEEDKYILMYVPNEDDLNNFKMLMENRADLQHVNEDGKSVIMYAADETDLLIFKMFMENRASIHFNEDGNSVVTYAAQEGDLDIFKMIMEKRIDPHRVNEEGKSILMYAAEAGNLDSFKILVEKGADVRCLDNQDKNVLMSAAEGGNFDIFKMLLDKGNNIHNVDNEGKTVLMYATLGGNLKIFKMLIEKGADVHHVDKEGKTVLLYAAKEGYFEMVEMLIKCGADINHVDEHGNSALHYSVRK